MISRRSCPGGRLKSRARTRRSKGQVDSTGSINSRRAFDRSLGYARRSAMSCQPAEAGLGLRSPRRLRHGTLPAVARHRGTLLPEAQELARNRHPLRHVPSELRGRAAARQFTSLGLRRTWRASATRCKARRGLTHTMRDEETGALRQAGTRTPGSLSTDPVDYVPCEARTGARAAPHASRTARFRAAAGGRSSAQVPTA